MGVVSIDKDSCIIYEENMCFNTYYILALKTSTIIHSERTTRNYYHMMLGAIMHCATICNLAWLLKVGPSKT